MTAHTFIFTPGTWLGYGKLTFTSSPTVVPFYTKWICSTLEDGKIWCEQYIEKEEVKEILFNLFCITEIKESGFKITLKSESIGTIEGIGKIEENSLSWNFQQPTPFGDASGFQGKEIYTRQRDGEYLLKAEYINDKDHHTLINGRIWSKR